MSFPTGFKRLYPLLMGLFFLVSAGIPARAADAVTAHRRVIVIDPGHGGQSKGAVGPGGTLEKNVTFQLANLLADRLRPGYRVVLTRTGDYAMSPADRSAVANNQKAGLFISLHAASSFSHTVNRVSVYYYQADTPPPASGQVTEGPVPWDEIQSAFREKSNLLALRLRNRLVEVTPACPVSIDSAPLAVLAGAEMPAVLVEVGFLSDPKQEALLQDDAYLGRIADHIRAGIDDFFNNTETISTTDLQE